jgi:hypothetical protein
MNRRRFFLGLLALPIALKAAVQESPRLSTIRFTGGSFELDLRELEWRIWLLAEDNQTLTSLYRTDSEAKAMSQKRWLEFKSRPRPLILGSCYKTTPTTITDTNYNP